MGRGSVTGEQAGERSSRRAHALALPVLILAAGCAASSERAPEDLGTSVEVPRDAAAAELDLHGGPFDLAHTVDLVPPYPPGPYGAEVGDVPPNFSWTGYLDLTGVWPADRVPLTTVSLQDLRLSGGRYLFLVTGAYW